MTPVVAEVRSTVQLPVAPVVRQDGAESVPGPESLVKVISVPAGAFWKPPLPSFTFTWAVKVCVWPTTFVAVGGVIWMLASTNVLIASPEFWPTPSVWTLTGRPATVSVEDACPSTLPAVAELNMIVHWPDGFVFAPASSHVLSTPLTAALGAVRRSSA